MTLRLLPPGARGRFWYVRGTIDGQRIEISSGTTDKAEAEAFLERVRQHRASFAALTAGADAETERRVIPKITPLGEFERWLQATFFLDGETVLWRRDRRPLVFHPTDGYLIAKVRFGRWIKRVREHRLKFLLAHGWLPETIDHVDRNRSHNALSNLEASTPARQSANASPPRSRA